MECYYHNFPSIQYNLHPVLLCFTGRFLQYPCTMYCFAMFYRQISAISLYHVLFCYVLPSDFCNISVPCIVLLCFPIRFLQYPCTMYCFAMFTVRFLQYPCTMYCFAMFTIRFLQYSCTMYCFVTIFPDPKKNIKNKDN